MFQNLTEYIPNTSIRVVCAICLWVQKYSICINLHNTKNYWTFHNLLVFFQCRLIFLLQSLNILIYFSINIESSTCLNSCWFWGHPWGYSTLSGLPVLLQEKERRTGQRCTDRVHEWGGNWCSYKTLCSAQGLSVAPNHFLQKVMVIFP